ncbi:MAG: acetyl-CoA carboxylase biotin carboxyl carrier protein subunit, partial [Bdellovibrionia bacterium]
QRPGGWIVAECFQEIKGIKTSHFRKKMMLAETRNYLSAHFGRSTWFGELLQEILGGHSQGKASEDDLVAQFPGKVRKVMVQENERVKEGAVLVLIEAMKMEFAIRAPSSGRVIRMRVSEGEQIAPGTKFLDWETLENES